MNLSKLISSEEIIGGLEISSDSIRFILLKNDQSATETKIICEEKLGPKESLENLDLFQKKLSDFVKNKTSYILLVNVPFT